MLLLSTHCLACWRFSCSLFVMIHTVRVNCNFSFFIHVLLVYISLHARKKSEALNEYQDESLQSREGKAFCTQQEQTLS